jgi:hypothetical protein
MEFRKITDCFSPFFLWILEESFKYEKKGFIPEKK